MLTSVTNLLKWELSKMKRLMAGFVKMPGRVRESLLAMQEVFFPRKLFAE